MDQRLNMKQILDLHPELKTLGDEEQVNINHPYCPAGTDRKKRLYIKRKGGGYVGFCHHCGNTGGTKGKRSHIRRSANIVTNGDLFLPDDMDYNLKTMDVNAVMWLSKYGITQDEWRRFNIGWSKTSGRVILPIYSGAGRLLAYQRRRVLPNDDGPKYLTTRLGKVKYPMFLGTRPEQIRSKTVVLTEDILSAVKVSRQVKAHALLGVFLGDGNMYEVLANGVEHVGIWLDDDNSTVRAQQRKIHKRLSMYCDCTIITGHTVDPKEMTDEQIKQVLEHHGLAS